MSFIPPRIRFRVEPEETPPWPGPDWEPTVYNAYPHTGGEAGDIYVNRYKDPPLYYLFNERGNCEMVSPEEIKQWVAGGSMKLPTPGQTIVTNPSRKSQRPLPRE